MRDDGLATRLGHLARRLVEAATRLAINFYSCVNTATQHAAVAAINGPQDAIELKLSTFAQRRDVIVDALNRLPGVHCVVPGGAFYAFPDITGTGFSSSELQNRWLEEAGVAAISGASFGPLGEGHVRFSYASSLDNIREAMRRLGAWLGQHRRVAPAAVRVSRFFPHPTHEAP